MIKVRSKRYYGSQPPRPIRAAGTPVQIFAVRKRLKCKDLRTAALREHDITKTDGTYRCNVCGTCLVDPRKRKSRNAKAIQRSGS